MNVKNGDFRGLVNQVSIAADKNLSEVQVLSLIDAMMTAGWQESYRVTVGVVRTGNLPRNIYGHFLALLEDEAERRKKGLLQRDQWAVKDEDCATPEEFSLTMKCIGLLCRFENAAELCHKFGEYLESAVKYNHLLESLKKAEIFYTDMYNKGKKVKPEIAEERAF